MPTDDHQVEAIKDSREAIDDYLSVIYRCQRSDKDTESVEEKIQTFIEREFANIDKAVKELEEGFGDWMEIELRRTRRRNMVVVRQRCRCVNRSERLAAENSRNRGVLTRFTFLLVDVVPMFSCAKTRPGRCQVGCGNHAVRTSTRSYHDRQETTFS